jgi:peptidyl-prolyl cis-trans isomerase B (cyclophilin B)
MSPTLPLVMFMAVLFPSKLWFAPSQAVNIDVHSPAGQVALELTDFDGKPVPTPAGASVEGNKTVDLKALYPDEIGKIGTYVLWAVPTGKPLAQFVGTPLVVEVRGAPAAAGVAPTVVYVEPLRYAVLSTELGKMTLVFYFDVAPVTSESFLTLAQGGYYDGLTFHRIFPGFVIQGGDPRGDGTGGPGYTVQAEFNDHQHLEGVLSMAREGDPNEAQGAMPGPEFANSAGSQFFICLDYTHTQQLDKRYTAFGKVVDGMDTVRAIAKLPVGGPSGDTPVKAAVKQSVKVVAVTSANNPYAQMMGITGAAPATQP